MSTKTTIKWMILSYILFALVLFSAMIKPCDVTCHQELTTSSFYGGPVISGHTNDYITSLSPGDLMWWEKHLYVITEKHILVEYNLDDNIQDFVDTSTGKYMDYNMIESNWFAENDLTMITCIGFTPDPLGRIIIVGKRLL
jgi:hypothetical protein